MRSFRKRLLSNCSRGLAGSFMETPDAFGLVEPGFYRASSLPGYCFPFLEKLCLKVIVVLDSGSPSSSLVEFTESHSIRLLHLGTQPWRSVDDVRQQYDSWRALSEALKVVLDARNYPLLVVDINMFTGLVRRLENWTYSAILGEYNVYAGARASLLGAVFLERVKFHVGKTEESEEYIAEQAKQDPMVPILTIELPSNEFIPDWARRFEIAKSISAS